MGTYTDIRWYSFGEVLHSLKSIWARAEEFAEKEKRKKLKSYLTDQNLYIVSQLSGLFLSFQTGIKILESDDFGTVSHVLPIFRSLHGKAEALPPFLII